MVYSLPSSQRIPWIHYFPLDANVGQFLSLLVVFKNTKTSRHSEIKQTRPSTKQDFSGEALSKQNTEASLASLSCNSSRVPTKWSAIFAFGYWYKLCLYHIHSCFTDFPCLSVYRFHGKYRSPYPWYNVHIKPIKGRLVKSCLNFFGMAVHKGLNRDTLTLSGRLFHSCSVSKLEFF